jgi:hypothetical protein
MADFNHNQATQPATQPGDEPGPEQHPISRRRLLATGGAAAGALIASSFRPGAEPVAQTAQGAAQGTDAALGAALYRVVTEYADLGDHRTGTPVDEQTIKWLTTQFTNRGAQVELQEYSFERYDARAKVTVEGKEVSAWPLYYEAVGRVATDKPYIGQVEIVPGSGMRMSTLLAQARAARAAAVVFATIGAEGRLVAINRGPRLGQGPPTIFVPGALAATLTRAKVEVDFEASLTPARSANLIARFGPASERAPLIITTPITGWFRCAGQHGTSIAVALEVASALAKLAPVWFVGATGNELNGLGARHYLRHARPNPQAVLHLGASVAAGRKEKNKTALSLTDQLFVATSLGANQHGKLNQALHPVGLKFTHVPEKEARDPEKWRGEARLWCRLGAPMLSVVGPFPLFHTPDDLPELATSPALLAGVCRATIDAARLLIAGK